jgi:bHLH factor
MAESVVAEQPDLAGGSVSPAHKRKRGVDPVSPESRRSKRAAPPAAMSDSDAATAAFIENAVSATQAIQEHVNVEDFNALQQAAAEHSEAADPANASSTAAAALGSMYPTLHVPQTTEETFAAQAGADVDASFNTSGVGDGLSGSLASANGIHEPRYGGSNNPKPAVGSEEWHKMRKDNHKEGE